MQSLPSGFSVKAVFIKAFLAVLQRGDVECAVLFARAFLTQERPPEPIIFEEPLAPELLN